MPNLKKHPCGIVIRACKENGCYNFEAVLFQQELHEFWLMSLEDIEDKLWNKFKIKNVTSQTGLDLNPHCWWKGYNQLLCK